MAKRDQILTIDPPNELAFHGPFTSAVSSVMKLTNPSEHKICFKIKTTAPKRYCVKPNSGVIDPKETVQIFVSLQPFEFDPTDKNRHKFMVQAMIAPDGEINQDTLWKETDPALLMDSKLKCLFVMPPTDETNHQGEDKNEFQAATSAKSSIPPSPKAGGNDHHMMKSIEEVKKLQEEVSTLRQENIQLKEDALRLKRLAARNPDSDLPSGGFGSSSTASSSGFSSTQVTATNPNANALSTAYLYLALLILILGVILGKWIL